MLEYTIRGECFYAQAPKGKIKFTGRFTDLYGQIGPSEIIDLTSSVKTQEIEGHYDKDNGKLVLAKTQNRDSSLPAILMSMDKVSQGESVEGTYKGDWIAIDGLRNGFIDSAIEDPSRYFRNGISMAEGKAFIRISKKATSQKDHEFYYE